MNYLTVAEVAARFRLSKMSIYRAIQDGSIRAVKIGRQFRIPMSEIERIENER